MSIRQRKSTALRAIEAAVRANLEGHLISINADLDAEGAGYRFLVDQFGSDVLSVMSAGQGPVLPEDVNYPAIRVVRGPGRSSWVQASGQGRSNWPVYLWHFLSMDQVVAWDGVTEAPLYVGDESLLMRAHLDLEDALRWCLTAHTALASGGSGVVTIREIETEHELEDFAGDGEVTALTGVLTIHLTQETPWSLTP